LVVPFLSFKLCVIARRVSNEAIFFAKIFFSPRAFPCTFLGGKKSTKRTAPCGLAFGCPRASGFFSSGQELARLRRCSDSLPAFLPKNPLAFGCAAKGGGFRQCLTALLSSLRVKRGNP